METLLEFATKFGLGFAAGLILIVVILEALKRFLSNLKFFKQKQLTLTELNCSLEPIKQQQTIINNKIDQLHNWQQNNQKLFESSIDKLSDAITELSYTLKEISLIQKEIRRDLDKLSDTVKSG